MDPIEPSRILYIKLGEGGAWEWECIKRNQCLKLGYIDVSHDLCLQRKWDKVREELQRVRRDKGAATRVRNQIRLFYESDESVLWITFFGDRLFWCFSEPTITLLPDNFKTRPVMGKWRSTDITGKPLQRNRLSGRLLCMERFSGTICSVKESEYLIRKINCMLTKDVQSAEQALEILEARIESLIGRLHWKDFEILIDLIFRQAGWQRISVLGGTEKYLDLDLISPITSERYGVQVKAKASLAEYEDYQKKFADMQGYSRLYFVVADPSDDLLNLEDKKSEDLELLLLTDIAHLAVQYGLSEWIIYKTAQDRMGIIVNGKRGEINTD